MQVWLYRGFSAENRVGRAFAALPPGPEHVVPATDEELLEVSL